MKIKTYANALSFRTALETRLNEQAKEAGIQTQKLRRQIAFDRLLARLFHKNNSSSAPWALKGGYAMELRVDNARATKDIDLAIKDAKLLSSDVDEQNITIRKLLDEYAQVDLKDFFVFKIADAMRDFDATPYGGGRFPIEALMNDHTFVKFHLDVGVGDVWMEPLESIEIHDWLSFANIKPIKVLAISKEQQFAEKIHAYTLPRDRQNSRVKDLVDMVLLIEGGMNSKRISESIFATYKRRKTHDFVNEMTPPPEKWQDVFKALAEECDLKKDIDESFKLVKSFVQKIEIMGEKNG